MMNELKEFFANHWEAVLVPAVGLFGWFLGKYRERGKWIRREFHDRINVSLNYIENGKLQIRTLIEKPCEEVFLSGAATEDVARAAQNTTEEDSLLPLKAEDYWFFLNPVLNEVSEQFAEGFIKKDLGLQVTMDSYLICLTCETAGTLRQRKVRAMVVKKSLLLAFPDDVSVEEENHSTRVKTLKQLAASYQENPSRFIELEICI